MELDFRKIEVNDAPVICRIRNESREYLHDESEYSLEDVTKWIVDTSPDWYAIIMNGKMIGYFRLSEWSKRNRTIYVGADISQDMRGMGIGKQAYIQFLKKLFVERKLSKVLLEVLSSNFRARNLYEQLGFTVDGVRRNAIWRKEGLWEDSIFMSLPRSKFYAKYTDCEAKWSPCIGICSKDDDKCNACQRTIEEIKNWSEYKSEERKEILSYLSTRIKVKSEVEKYLLSINKGDRKNG